MMSLLPVKNGGTQLLPSKRKERKMKKRTEMVKNKMSDFVNSIIIICFRVTYKRRRGVFH